jgi:hypothetical protein
MDAYRRHHIGVRGGRNCPCCRLHPERGGKPRENRHARRGFARETTAMVREGYGVDLLDPAARRAYFIDTDTDTAPEV